MDNTANKTKHITTIGATIVDTPCLLVALVINSKGGSSNTAKIYNGNSTVKDDPQELKAIVDTTSSIGTLSYGIPMLNGIYLITATGTQADLTLIYREIKNTVN